MNKQALKLKKKRQAIRNAQKAEKLDKIWNDVNEFAKENGFPEMKKTKAQLMKVYNARKQVDTKVLNMGGIIALVCSIYTLHQCFDFNHDKILEYSFKLKKFIISIADNNRNILDLLDDFKQNYNIDIIDKCIDLPHYDCTDMNKMTMNDTIIRSTITNFPYFIGINMYCFMNYTIYNCKKSCNAPELNKFMNNVFILYINILNKPDYLITLDELLVKEKQIYIDLESGTVNEVENIK